MDETSVEWVKGPEIENEIRDLSLEVQQKVISQVTSSNDRGKKKVEAR